MLQQGQQVVDTVDLGGRSLDFSMWGMFMQADIVVQAVMMLLVLASFWSWAIIYEKLKRIKQVGREADDFEDAFWSGNSLEDLYGRIKAKPDHPLAMVFVAAMREWKRSMKSGNGNRDKLSIQGRIEKVMRVTNAREMERLERHTGFLASVGANATFVGLFGTVWGIMNSFQAIALTSNTSLAVVAPGIAEALFATALGLVAAIPAVMAYNKIATDLERYAVRMDGFSDEFSSILSRQLDEKLSS
jgi:biopolymer transport protein TolQ